MNFGPALLRAVLEEHLPAAATGLMVGVSGGADSACLLTALAQTNAKSSLGLHIRAAHIDHRLQPASVVFREASVALCLQLGIPLSVVEVTVETGGGVSIEAAARDARYRGFALELAAGECLLTAHHAEDQAETLLLQLLRGAGLKGLSAMPMCRPLGQGWHLRPLLKIAQKDLRKYGEAQVTVSVDDPMNQDPRFDRSYLRSQVWPLIERRWPGAAIALSRTAGHIAEAQELLDQSAVLTVSRLRDGDALSLTGLRALTKLEQINTLRNWLFSTGVTPPSTSRLTEGLRQMLTADGDHLPVIAWREWALRRYRERIFITPAVLPSIGANRVWRCVSESPLDLGAGLGLLRWAPQIGGLDVSRLPDTLCVRQRRGGESLRIGRGAKTHTVQHLCQSWGVLPWMRDALPMIYAGDALIAVGDLWQDVRWCVAAGAPGFGCVWEGAPVVT
jgi:tRNA(Ile)-lysidine synthase